MDAISLEFYSDSKDHLKILEHALKEVAGVRVDLVAPRDTSAPVLVGISIFENTYEATRGIAKTLYTFLHTEESEQNQKTISLVTIEGDRMNIGSLSEPDIYQIIANAQGELK